MNNQPITDVDVAIAFLLAVRHRGPWTLVAMHPDRVHDFAPSKRVGYWS